MVSSGSKFLKVLFRVLLLLGVFRFLTVVEAAENGGRNMNGGLHPKTSKNIKHRRVEVNMGREKHRAPSKFDHLNYSSKRRVPNGPDPIHNRRAGKSRQPPGQA